MHMVTTYEHAADSQRLLGPLRGQEAESLLADEPLLGELVVRRKAGCARREGMHVRGGRWGAQLIRVTRADAAVLARAGGTWVRRFGRLAAWGLFLRSADMGGLISEWKKVRLSHVMLGQAL